MFGYVKTDFPNLYVKDTVLYKAMYCGLCKSIGCVCGTRGRFVLNYDLTFLSTLLHNILDTDVTIEKQRCILHTIVKRPIAKVDELSKKIGALNVILAYYKLSDDVLDNKKGRLKRAFFKKAYKKAKNYQPYLDKIVQKRYNELFELEKQNIDSIDIAADPFGNMMVEIVECLVGNANTENLKNLSYNLGKWIYLIDALDDFDKDKKKGNFNVFVNAYKNCQDKNQFVTESSLEISAIFGGILSDITFNASKLDYKFNHDLLDNVLFRGLNAQTKCILDNKKCKNYAKF